MTNKTRTFESTKPAPTNAVGGWVVRRWIWRDSTNALTVQWSNGTETRSQYTLAGLMRTNAFAKGEIIETTH
jgi:hypothetical protein